MRLQELKAQWESELESGCPECGASPGDPCVTITGRAPGTPYDWVFDDTSPMALVSDVYEPWNKPTVHHRRACHRTACKTCSMRTGGKEDTGEVGSRAAEVRDAIADMVKAGWEKEERDNDYVLTRSGMNPIVVPKKVSGQRWKIDLDAKRRRAQIGAVASAAAAGAAPPLPSDPHPTGEPDIIEREPSGSPGVDRILLSSGTEVFGCQAAACSGRRFETIQAACGHRSRTHVQAATTPRREAVARVREWILEGLDQGQQLSSVRTIAHRLGLAEDTVQRATDSLIREGILLDMRAVDGVNAIFAVKKGIPDAVATPATIPRANGVKHADPVPAPQESVTDLLQQAAALLQRASNLATEHDASRVAALESELAEERTARRAIQARVDALMQAFQGLGAAQ